MDQPIELSLRNRYLIFFFFFDMEIGIKIEDMIINFKFEFNKVFTNYKVFILKVEFKMLENNMSLENVRHIKKRQKFSLNQSKENIL
jgi:hypothetical protein